MIAINVQQKHINTGFRDPKCNPIALAIREQLIPHPISVIVTPFMIHIDGESIYNEYDVYELIRHYEAFGKMEPFTFSLPYGKPIETTVEETN